MSYGEPFVYESVSNFQVLQRDSNDEAKVRINNKVISLSTGGPYTVEDAHDIYVGDIWVMSGQSNMRGHGFLRDPYTNRSFALPPIPNVHLFNSEEVWTIAQDPMHQLSSSPREVHHTLPDPTVHQPSILNYRGASLGLSFAKTYQSLYQNVPVGLIASAHGGTSLDDWKPVPLTDQTANTTLYGAMLERIKKVGQIKGILWYQGESDTNHDSKTYFERFKDWMERLRQDLGDTLPFIFVQIGAHRLDKLNMIEGWMEVQDAQQRLFRVNPYTAGVASLDGGLDDRLHLSASGLCKVGHRLALATQYVLRGQGQLATPLPKFAVLEYSDIADLQKKGPPSVLVKFDAMEETQWENDLDQDILGFSIVSEDKSITILSSRIEEDRKSIRLYLSNRTAHDVSISYGMNENAYNLVATNGTTLPAFKGLHVKHK